MTTPSNPSILIVEDEDEFRLLLRLVLDQSYGCRDVTEVSFADEALAAAAQGKPDVILLDVHLPDGDGVVLLPSLQAVSPGSSIVLMSSDPDTRTMLDGAAWVDKAHLLEMLPGMLGLGAAP